MARHGDGLYKRGKSWYLDCRINGVRVQERLGKDISRSVAKELANVTRTRFLRGEAGIGKKLKDCTFVKAKIEFLKHTQTDKRPRTYKVIPRMSNAVRAVLRGKTPQLHNDMAH